MTGTGTANDSFKVRVTLYTRPGCHLCVEAKSEMLAAQCPAFYLLEEVNIDTDPELTRRYGWDIPVLLINGVETFKHRVTAAAFRQEVERVFRERAGG